MKQISLKNEFLSLKVLDYGAIIQELIMKDKRGRTTQLVAGLPEPEAYLNDKACMGACVGRFAGRISGSFELDQQTYPLHTVAENVHLHGGAEGFFRKYWQVDKVWHEGIPGISLSYTSPHMEEGYPGTVRAQVTYELDRQTLRITHTATTDRKTVINLVNHSYFLLDQSGSVRNYQLQLNSSSYLDTHENLLPTGKILEVKGTPFDFRQPRPIGDYHLDTPFVLDMDTPEAVCMYSEDSGIRLRVVTDQPGVVVYTPRDFAGICFETQNLPDAPNHSHFPSCILEPGQVYTNCSEFKFDLPG